MGQNYGKLTGKVHNSRGDPVELFRVLRVHLANRREKEFCPDQVWGGCELLEEEGSWLRWAVFKLSVRCVHERTCRPAWM